MFRQDATEYNCLPLRCLPLRKISLACICLTQVYSSPMKQINRLRVLRADRRLSQMDTAADAGISITRYWKIENGYVEPTKDERDALVKVFQVSVNDIFPSDEAKAMSA